MLVDVRTVARGSDHDGIAPTGLVSSAPGLIIDLDVCRDGRVVEVAPLVKQGDVNQAVAIGLSAEEIIYLREPGNLCISVRTAVARETGVDAVGPGGRLVSPAV